MALGALAAPLAAGAASGVLGALMGGGQGSGGTSQTYQPFLTNIQGGGLFNTSFGPQGANIALTPEMQAIQSGLFGQAQGATPLQQQYQQLGQGFLGQVGAFDPFAAAETQFNRLESILAPQREQQRQAQESRLYAQGRLGSTGGGIEQQAFQQAVENQRTQNLVNALGQAQDIQGNLISRGTALSNMPIDLQNQALANLLNVQGAGLQQLRGGAFGGGTQTTQQVYPSVGQQIGTGLLMGGLDMFGQGLSGMFRPSPATGTSPGNVSPNISGGAFSPNFSFAGWKK